MGQTLCPRCEVNYFTPYGAEPASEEAPKPALSRAVDVHICNWCGIHEAFMDLAGVPHPTPEEWPVVLPEFEKVIS